MKSTGSNQDFYKQKYSIRDFEPNIFQRFIFDLLQLIIPEFQQILNRIPNTNNRFPTEFIMNQ